MHEVTMGNLSFASRMVTPRMPPGQASIVSSSEPKIPPIFERDHSSGFSTFIAYRNEEGHQSRRRIVCKAIFIGRTGMIVGAYCVESEAYKHFRVDRILELIDIQTAEVLNPEEIFEGLHLRGALRITDHVLTDVARLLVFMAKCDGNYHPLEESALYDAFQAYCLRFGGNDQLVENTYAAAGKLAPDGNDITRVLRNLGGNSNGPALARFVLDRSTAVMDADGRQHPREFAWALELSEHLTRLAGR